ncbi:MAG: dTDP-glucose 4,6-dehydratase [Verrucomicrobiota bacterium]|nr:dTDP-glucose 4,6-dehydratase [Verrucomicrobiota bacterium]
MRVPRRILVTGGAGFIGSGFVRFAMRQKEVERLVNFDLLTYAASLSHVAECTGDPRYRFVQGNILDQPLVEKILCEEKIDALVHFAAETHVDRSILSARPFVETNVLGTLSLLEAARTRPQMHFHHISTDEVFGSLGEEGSFVETSPYSPNSPYAASKAGADHLVRAFAHTYGLSTTISHASNTYGPCQYPEKLIPLVIRCCLDRQPIPIYGNGRNVRDWLYVDDHAAALWSILCKGRRGASYNVGGENLLSNLDLVSQVIDAVAQNRGESREVYHKLIRFVSDRPGHDFRYATDCSYLKKELGWSPEISMKTGLSSTVSWYTQTR